MKVYFDDTRKGPNGDPESRSYCDDWKEWVVVRGMEHIKQLLELGLVTDLSLDHDVGQNQDGYDLCKWMGETGNWPSGRIWVHSGNVVGRKNMVEYIKRYCPTMRDSDD